MSERLPQEHAQDDRATQAWNVYQRAFRTLQGYQTGGLTATDLRNAQNQIQAELQAYATGLVSQPDNVQQAVRALHGIQRQINNALAAPVSPADQRFSSPDAYTERFGLVRFGQEITQTYLVSQNGTPTWGLLLGDDPTPVFTSPRPITVADFRAPNGPVQQALTRAGEARSLTEPSTGATQTVAPTAASTRYGEPQLLQGARGGGGAQPATGEQRVVDIDPDGAGPLDATYVGLDRGQNRVQTRVVEVQQYDGRQWATTGFEARGVSVTDLRANRIVSERPGRTYRLEGASTPEEAIERARVMLEHGAISTSSPSDGPPRSVLDRTNDGRFETQSLIVPKGLEGLGNRWVAGFREVLDAQVGADAQRYLKAGNALIGLRGTELQNYVGVALDLAPNVMPVRGAGNQLLYKGEALQAVSTVSDAIRAAGGEAPQVRAVPVYLRVADDKMAKTTIFRVQGRDGRERIVDNVGRTYASLQKWRENNQLGAVDVFLPQGGQLQGRDGKVVLEAFNNRRFDNTALPWLRGGVAILGAGAGVAVMLGTGGVAAPLVMAGGAVFSAVDGAATLADLNWHGQSLALTARQARAAWLDFGAGLLGGLAIGTGAKALARASDLADLLTLGNGVGDLASDWDKLSPGERALAGAQLAFWASMLGASQFSGGRFNLDPLLARGGGGDVGTRGGDAGVNTTRPGGGRSGGTNNADPGERPYRPGESRPVNRTSPRSQTPPTTPDPKVEFRQQIQQMSEQVFQSGDFRQRLTDRVTPAEVDVIASNQTRLLQLAQDVALETVVERTFSGSGVPQAVQQGFRGRAETWAQRQARVNGGTAAGWLEALVTAPNGSGHRAELLRPLVAEHLGGGNERLQNAVEAQLRPLNESALKNLVALGRDGQPQQATVDLLRRALVARWAEDYRLSAQDQHRLDQAIGQRLEGKNRGEQRTELVNLASSNQTRDALVGQARGTPATVRVNPETTREARVDTSQPPGADSNSATRVGNGGGDVVAGPTDAGNGGGLPPTGNGPGAAGSSGRGDADPRVAMGTRVNRASIRTVEAANVSDVSVARGADGRVEPVQFILRTPVPRSDRFTERLVTITSGDRLTDAEVIQLRASVISGNTHTYNARQNAQIDADLRRAEVVVTVQNLEARPGGAEGELTVTGAAAQASVRRNPAQPGVAETSYVQLVVSGEGTTGARMEALPAGASSLFPDRGTPQLRYGVPGGASQAAEILVRAMDQLGMPPSAFYNTRPGERLPDSRVSDLYVGIKPDSLVTFPGLLPDGRIRHYVLERNPDGSWPEGYRPPNPETGERALWAGQEVIPPPSSRPIEEGGVPIRPGRQLPPASDGTPGSQNVPGDGRGTPGADGGAGTDPSGSGSITSGTSPGAKPSRPARFDASSSDEFKQQLRQDVSAKLSGSTAVPDNIRDEVASAVYNEALRRAQSARSPEAAAAIAQRYLDELGTQPQTLKLVVDRAERGRRQAVEGLATQFVRDHGFRNQDRRQVLSIPGP